MADPALVKQVAELKDAVRFLAGHVVLLERELGRVRGTVSSMGAMAATATPDADDPDTVARATAVDFLTELAAGQPAEPAPSISSSVL